MTEQSFTLMMHTYERDLFKAKSTKELSQSLMFLSMAMQDRDLTYEQFAQLEALSNAYDIKLERLYKEEEGK